MNKVIAMLMALICCIIAPALAYTTTSGMSVSNSDISSVMYSSLITNQGVRTVIVSTDYSHIDALVQIEHNMAWNDKVNAMTNAFLQYKAVVEATDYRGYLQVRMYCATCGIQYQRVWMVSPSDMSIGTSYVTNVPRYYDKAGDITKDVVYEGTRYSPAVGDWL